ncbi:3f33d14a-84dd-4e12-a04f-f0b55ef7bf48 [Thermothielavioides terrestris]|uniref:3f33d14a-84dd-4e12-a04f-f0b55ef7bf48 n=1 Tax=Thermothielavioides terrestris TaxID=2587410 RepID=A0A446BS74_9PEZI|nr:3f33d14a-84dd-4e12-a04f-f0b55ef7bf48 [Thermothielavioides terrestris]
MSVRSLLDTVLLLVILGLLLDRGWQGPSRFEVGGDITGFGPQISQQIKTFTPDPTFVPENYTEFFTDEVKARWLSIVPSELERMPQDGPWHISHCFEYLRQSIMCCADVALEGQQTTFPPGFTGSDGWDAKHVCKDYNQVLAHLEKNRANDEVWISTAHAEAAQKCW